MKNKDILGFELRRTIDIVHGFLYPEAFKNAKIFEYHLESGWCFATDTKSVQFREDYEMGTSRDTYEVAEFMSMNLRNPTIMYRTPIFIWNLDDAPVHPSSDWCNDDYFIFDGMIYYVISDFAGLRVYNQTLDIIFELPITPEMKRYNDVYGFHVDMEGRRLVSWIVINQNERDRQALAELGLPEDEEDLSEDEEDLSEDEEDEETEHLNYDNVSLVPEEQRVYHNIF
jgi:hypothetical protein